MSNAVEAAQELLEVEQQIESMEDFMEATCSHHPDFVACHVCGDAGDYWVASWRRDQLIKTWAHKWAEMAAGK